MRILGHNLANFFLISLAVILVEVVGFSLRRRIKVGVIQQVLNSTKDLLDSNGWSPSLFFAQD